MAQQLKALADLAEVPFQHPHGISQLCLQFWDPKPSGFQWYLYSGGAHKLTDTHTHKQKLKRNKFLKEM